MKNLITKLLLIGAFLCISSGSFVALPVYTGDTYADWGVGGYPDADEAVGRGMSPGSYIGPMMKPKPVGRSDGVGRIGQRDMLRDRVVVFGHKFGPINLGGFYQLFWWRN